MKRNLCLPISVFFFILISILMSADVLSDTWSSNDPTEDGYVTYSKEDIYDPIYGRSTNSNRLMATGLDIFGWKYVARMYVEWNVGGIQDDAIIDSVSFRYHGASHNPASPAGDCRIRHMALRPSAFGDSQVYSDAGSGTTYAVGNDAGFPIVAQNRVIDLGPDAVSELQTRITSGNWFAIGIQLDNELQGWSSEIYSENYVSANPKPTLYVTYHVADETPPTFSNCHQNVTNNTAINTNTPIYLGCQWNDKALDMYVNSLKINNLGSWTNGTWQSFSAGNWTNFTVIFPPAEGSNITVKIYANDTSGNQRVTGTWFWYNVSVAPDTQPPTYSLNRTSSTIAGASILHYLNWTDNSDLSGYIFSFDNCTGSLTNSSWTPFGANTWSNEIRTINSTVDCTIRWCVYANDTFNNWNESSCINPFSYTTSSSPYGFKCYIGTECNYPNVTIFRMWDVNNSHAELPSGDGNYDYKVCCSGVDTTCTGNYDIVLKLSNLTNAHVEKKIYANYIDHDACMSVPNGAVICNYSSDCESLGSDYICLASISNESNAHVGDCNAYSEKVCCKVIPGVTIDPLCDPYDDFTGKCQDLALYGDLSYLNIRWNAHYADYVPRKIGVNCYLNCLNPGTNITGNCDEIPTNYCNYQSLTGYGFCTILNPNYLFQGQPNNVTCGFYNPAYPDIQFLPYPNRTFKPIEFDISSVLNTTATVGKPFILPVRVRNFGLLVDSFTSNTSILFSDNPDTISIENPIDQTGNLKYNEVGEIYSRINFLSTGKTNFEVLVKSNLDRSSCTSDSDCDYLDLPGSDAECIDGSCWKRITVGIDPGISSLPEFGWTGMLQIILLSAVAVFFLKRRY